MNGIDEQPFFRVDGPGHLKDVVTVCEEGLILSLIALGSSGEVWGSSSAAHGSDDGMQMGNWATIW